MKEQLRSIIFEQKKALINLRLSGRKKNLAATYSPSLLRQVPLATRVLTSEFGMGSGVSLSLLPPEKIDELQALTLLFTNFNRLLKMA